MCKEPLICYDKKTHGNRQYPPAWKALEFMTFGTIIKLYEGIKNPHLRCDISNHYGMSHPTQFANYINTVRKLRNNCAHEKVLFDMTLPQAIGDGWSMWEFRQQENYAIWRIQSVQILIG